MTNAKKCKYHQILRAIMMRRALVAVVFLVALLNCSAGGAAPVMPNESVVAAQVLDLTTIASAMLNMKPPQVLLRMKLRLLAVREVPPLANFLHGKSGDIIEVYSKQPLTPGLVGKVIKGRIGFRGDEHGGLYWIQEVTEGESRFFQ